MASLAEALREGGSRKPQIRKPTCVASALTFPTEDFARALISSRLSAMPLSAGTRLGRILVLLYLVSGLR